VSLVTHLKESCHIFEDQGGGRKLPSREAMVRTQEASDVGIQISCCVAVYRKTSTFQRHTHVPYDVYMRTQESSNVGIRISCCVAVPMNISTCQTRICVPYDVSMMTLEG